MYSCDFHSSWHALAVPISTQTERNGLNVHMHAIRVMLKITEMDDIYSSVAIDPNYFAGSIDVWAEREAANGPM